MRALAGKLYSDGKVAHAPAARRRTRIALTSPLFAFGGAALGSVAVWIGVFKLILG
jgi:hypothetical protein